MTKLTAVEVVSITRFLGRGRNIVGAGLLFAMLVQSLFVGSAHADEDADEDVAGNADDMVSVTFSYPKDPHSAHDSEFPILVLAHEESGEEFKLRRAKKMQTLNVPAGRYYLRQVIAGFFSFPSQPQAMPTSAKGFLELPPATVAYLGDVSWSAATGLRFGFTKEGLLRLQKIDSLHSSPLVLASFGREPQPVSWD